VSISKDDAREAAAIKRLGAHIVFRELSWKRMATANRQLLEQNSEILRSLAGATKPGPPASH
jgi:hypothetical protein